MRVLAFGDSITQGFWGLEGGWVERLRKHYDGLAIENLRANKQPEIFNLGVSGDTSQNLLERIEHEIMSRRWPGTPICVLLAIGTNDDLFEDIDQTAKSEQFKLNIQKILDIIDPLADKVMLIGNAACDETLTTPVFWADIHYTNAMLQAAEKILGTVARENTKLFVPVFDAFQAKMHSGKKLLEDGLHPNDEGHQLIFELVRPQLDKLMAQ